MSASQDGCPRTEKPFDPPLTCMEGQAYKATAAGGGT
jgi:hypothetical protein